MHYNMIRAGIVGAAGYTGGELIRILLHHHDVEIVSALSNSQAGKRISTVHQDLIGETELLFTDGLHELIDVLFLCMAHGAAREFLAANPVPDDVKIIDLSHDFRLKGHNNIGARNFIYGLPELHRDKIKMAENVANPGCFATALQLGLLPLAVNGFSGKVYTTGITGATGAGRVLSQTSQFAWRTNNIQAYKTLKHQHIKEVQENLEIAGSYGLNINFVPWRGDFARGIFVSQQLETDLNIVQLQELYSSFYAGHPFVQVSHDPIHLKQVVHTNKCVIQLEQSEEQTVIHSAIDNLLKGASGQAVQNMNLMFGLDETIGLKLKAGYF
jgi:N-acetyl-gamma-glutamyl-phosphate reductase